METNREKIILYKKEHPDWTLAYIGSLIGVTKQRVRQVLLTNNLPTKRLKEYCFPCIVCKTLILSKNTSKVICSDECKKKLLWVNLLCTNCKISISRLKSVLARDLRKKPNKLFFCSKSCNISYLWAIGVLSGKKK